MATNGLNVINNHVGMLLAHTRSFSIHEGNRKEKFKQKNKKPSLDDLQQILINNFISIATITRTTRTIIENKLNVKEEKGTLGSL